MEQAGLMWRRKRYYVEDGFIKPDLSEIAAPYYLMDAYKKDRGPHLELAELSLEDEEAIAAFCSKWGLLGVVPRKLVFIANGRRVLNKRDFSEASHDLLQAVGSRYWHEYYFSCADHKEWENLGHFREKAAEFQRMFHIKAAIFPKVHFDRVAELGADCDPIFLSSELTAWLNTELEGQLQLMTFLERDEKTGIAKEYSAYIFDGLLTGLILMLKMDLQHGIYTRQCKYRKCKRWFSTFDARSLYCPGSDHKEKEKSLNYYIDNRAEINAKRRKKNAGLGDKQ